MNITTIWIIRIFLLTSPSICEYRKSGFFCILLFLKCVRYVLTLKLMFCYLDLKQFFYYLLWKMCLHFKQITFSRHLFSCVNEIALLNCIHFVVASLANKHSISKWIKYLVDSILPNVCPSKKSLFKFRNIGFLLMIYILKL